MGGVCAFLSGRNVDSSPVFSLPFPSHQIRAEMIAAGLAYPYAEPEKRVVSRSGNECVVALADQWYLKYGEPEWQAQVRDHVQSTMELYNPQTKKDFLLTIEWLHEWACSRGYGLGTRLPWDPQYVIESLSDSTIYMAYYTIAHLLQGPPNGDATAENASFLSGSKAGLAGIAAADLTDDVWNYIFLNKEFPEFPTNTTLKKEQVDVLRNEFEYWSGDRRHVHTNTPPPQHTRFAHSFAMISSF